MSIVLEKFRLNGPPNSGKNAKKEGFEFNAGRAGNPRIRQSFRNWLAELGYASNPFTFEIPPGKPVGYAEQIESIMDGIMSGSKIALLLGPTGSGKTTVLKWLLAQWANDSLRTAVFLPKPPGKPREFLDILNPYFESGFFRRKRARTLYELPEFINKQKGGRKILLVCDEAHEASDKVLMWMRTLSDNISGMSLLLAALPRFERDLGDRLETMRKRISVKESILSLTKEETRALIEMRMANAGGENIFSSEAMDYIYEKSAGFPREVLRLCDSALRKARDIGSERVTLSIIEEAKVISEPPIAVDSVPDRQRLLLESLANPTTAAQLSEKFTLYYKTKHHALRAINNLLHRLMEAGLVEREPSEKTYIYKLSPKAKTAFVTK